jgi:hypothetical protein
MLIGIIDYNDNNNKREEEEEEDEVCNIVHTCIFVCVNFNLTRTLYKTIRWLFEGEINRMRRY